MLLQGPSIFIFFQLFIVLYARIKNVAKDMNVRSLKVKSACHSNVYSLPQNASGWCVEKDLAEMTRVLSVESLLTQ